MATWPYWGKSKENAGLLQAAQIRGSQRHGTHLGRAWPGV